MSWELNIEQKMLYRSIVSTFAHFCKPCSVRGWSFFVQKNVQNVQKLFSTFAHFKAIQGKGLRGFVQNVQDFRPAKRPLEKTEKKIKNFFLTRGKRSETYFLHILNK
jgi:hypothetical protein